VLVLVGRGGGNERNHGDDEGVEALRGAGDPRLVGSGLAGEACVIRAIAAVAAEWQDGAALSAGFGDAVLRPTGGAVELCSESCGAPCSTLRR
jgi:hypothetical protein